MNYRLKQDDQEVGTFTVEELRRRRDAGELAGTDLVAPEGADEWRPLDDVLPKPMPKFIAPPPLPPVPPKKMNWLVVAVLVMAGGLMLTFAIVFGLAIHRGLQLAAPGLRRAITSGSPGSTDRSAAMVAASRPVTWSTDTPTWVQAQRAQREFRFRQYAEEYQQRGERNPECDLLAQQFLTNWIACNFGGTVDTNLPSLTELSDRLANDPACQDPVVLTVAAINTAELHEEVRRLERAVTGFADSKHRGYPKFFATVTLASKLVRDRVDRLPVLDAQAMQYLRAAFTDGSIRPGDQAEIGETLIHGWGESFRSRNAAAVAALVREQGDAFQWLALTLEGEHEIDLAWDARGSGYADSVSETGWNGFRNHLASARRSLTHAWELQPKLPLAPCRMITVALGEESIEDMRQWFDRATAAQVDYSSAWNDMRWGLRPRWYGDYDSMLAFGTMALKTRRFDTDIPRVFFDSLSDLESEKGLPEGQHLYASDDIWPLLQELYEGYIAEPSLGGYERDGWRSTYTVIASLAGKYEVAKDELQALNWQPHASRLTGWNRDLSLLPEEVAARTGAESDAVKIAERCRETGDVTGAWQRYQKLQASATADARTRRFVQERLASLSVEQQLETGGWVGFLPTDTNFTGWQAGLGSFKLLPDGALEASSDQTGHLLFSRVRLGTEFEVRGQFEVVSSTTKDFQAGLVMGTPQWETYNWYAFRMKRNHDEGDVVSFSQHWLKRQILAPVPLDSHTNSFDVRYQHGRISATVDDHEVFKNVAPPKNSFVSTNDFLLGFGAFNDSNSTVIRYRNVEVRRLSSP
jgi:hypothetical protein